MLRRLFLLLLWVLWSCLTIVTLAAPYPKQWHQMDNDRLFKMAKEFKTRQQMDSAMACYSIVANRLKAKGDLESKTSIITIKSRPIVCYWRNVRPRSLATPLYWPIFTTSWDAYICSMSLRTRVAT